MPGFKHPACHPLVIDDDQDFTLLLRRCLEKIGVPRSQIRACGDGDQAMRYLSDGHRVPSFILLDVNMPRRSGLEILEWIRSASSPVAEAMVFMLTSSTDSAHVSRAFQLGIGSYFIKPMDLPSLEVVLEGILAYWKRKDTFAIISGSVEPPAR